MTLAPEQIAALRDIAETWPERPTVIIGATALGFYIDVQWRQTVEVDLVIAVDVLELNDIAERAGWRQHPRKEHEFRSPGGAKIDILPATAALIEAGAITWPGGQVMSLVGMDLAFSHSDAGLVTGFDVRVAPPAVVAVLKMVSFVERSWDRERDLVDIAHLLELYVDEDSDRRWHEAADVDFELAPAFLFGRDVGRLITDAHRSVVPRFLERVAAPESAEHARMERLGPAGWRGQTHPLRRRLEALRRGYDRTLADAAAGEPSA